MNDDDLGLNRSFAVILRDARHARSYSTVQSHPQRQTHAPSLSRNGVKPPERWPSLLHMPTDFSVVSLINVLDKDCQCCQRAPGGLYVAITLLVFFSSLSLSVENFSLVIVGIISSPWGLMLATWRPVSWRRSKAKVILWSWKYNRAMYRSLFFKVSSTSLYMCTYTICQTGLLFSFLCVSEGLCQQ